MRLSLKCHVVQSYLIDVILVSLGAGGPDSGPKGQELESAQNCDQPAGARVRSPGSTCMTCRRYRLLNFYPISWHFWLLQPFVVEFVERKGQLVTFELPCSLQQIRFGDHCYSGHILVSVSVC